MANWKDWLAFLILFIAIIWAAAVGGVLYVLVLVLISAIYVYTDAKKRGIGPALGEKQELDKLKTWTPGSWAVLVFLFWIIFMPLYPWKRDEFTGKAP